MRIVSNETSCKTLKDIFPLIIASRIAPTAPTLAASVGVATPFKIDPRTAKTEMMQAFFENASEELLGKLEKQIPIRKFAESIDVANGILFLASDESKMITGTELVIDGGLSAQ